MKCLKAIIAIAQTRSSARAADRLGIVQSVASKRLERLRPLRIGRRGAQAWGTLPSRPRNAPTALETQVVAQHNAIKRRPALRLASSA